MSTLTDAQKVDIRRWAGYSAALSGDLAVYSDPIYSHAGPIWGLNRLTLADKLDGLTSAEEVALTAQYLTPLASLEAGVLGSADNMDTDTAGPWKANARELDERTQLYNRWRRDMCGFLGIPPGPGLGSGGIALVRG
jgi:hypothetical protein